MTEPEAGSQDELWSARAVAAGRPVGEALQKQKQSRPCLRLDKKDFIQNRERRDRREIDETQQEQFNNTPYLPPRAFTSGLLTVVVSRGVSLSSLESRGVGLCSDLVAASRFGLMA